MPYPFKFRNSLFCPKEVLAITFLEVYLFEVDVCTMK